MNDTELTDRTPLYTLEEISSLIQSLPSLFSGNDVTLLPSDCRVFWENINKESRDIPIAELHISIRPNNESDFRIFDENNALKFRPTWKADTILHIISALITKYYEMQITQLAQNAFQEANRAPLLQLWEQSMVWQEESYNSDLKIYFKLCGDSEQDELKEVEFANLLKNLPEYANRSFHGESIMSIIERKVPLVEIRKIESEPAHQYSPPELKLLERWSDLSVKLVSDDSIRIKINHERSQEYHYVKLGFDDKRRGLQTSNIRWKWIILLAKYDGCIRVGESEVLDFEKRAKTEKGISILRNDLKSIFELNENPIVGAKRSGVFEYTCAFTINDLRGQQG